MTKKTFLKLFVLGMMAILITGFTAIIVDGFHTQTIKNEELSTELERERKINNTLMWQIENIKPSDDR